MLRGKKRLRTIALDIQIMNQTLISGFFLILTLSTRVSDGSQNTCQCQRVQFNFFWPNTVPKLLNSDRLFSGILPHLTILVGGKHRRTIYWKESGKLKLGITSITHNVQLSVTLNWRWWWLRLATMMGFISPTYLSKLHTHLKLYVKFVLDNLGYKFVFFRKINCWFNLSWFISNNIALYDFTL